MVAHTNSHAFVIPCRLGVEVAHVVGTSATRFPTSRQRAALRQGWVAVKFGSPRPCDSGTAEGLWSSQEPVGYQPQTGTSKKYNQCPAVHARKHGVHHTRC